MTTYASSLLRCPSQMPLAIKNAVPAQIESVQGAGGLSAAADGDGAGAGRRFIAGAIIGGALADALTTATTVTATTVMVTAVTATAVVGYGYGGCGGYYAAAPAYYAAPAPVYYGGYSAVVGATAAAGAIAADGTGARNAPLLRSCRESPLPAAGERSRRSERSEGMSKHSSSGKNSSEASFIEFLMRWHAMSRPRR